MSTTGYFCVRDSFPAAHRIRTDGAGTREPIHVHHWRVEACFQVMGDPGAAGRASLALQRWVLRHRGRSLNDVAPYATVNPTAEEVARTLAIELGDEVQLQVVRVTVGEAAGFSATYLPDTAAADSSRG